MSRPCWVGSLSFGLVHVPVRLYAAAESKQVSFHLLHDADGARLRQKRVCSADGQEVVREHVVKGYEISPGQHVELTQEELSAFDPKASHTLELEDFIELKEVDPSFYEATYHLVPEPGAEHPYTLLVTALARSGRVGLGRLVMRHKSHLCLVRPAGRGLALSTLYYAEELISQETLPELSEPGRRPAEQEVEMVLRLIQSQATSFEPRRYRDTHRERLLAFLERRGRAQAKVAPVPRQPRAEPAVTRMDEFHWLEEGIAALRRGGRDAILAHRTAPAQGELRFRPQAARSGRGRPGQEGEASSSLPGKDGPSV